MTKYLAKFFFWLGLTEIHRKQNSSVYPGLFYCYKRILCIQGSLVPSEQLFSHTGYSVWVRRNRLDPENVNKIMVVYEYY